MRPTQRGVRFGAVLAAAVFAALAIAMTGVVRGSGHQIADTVRYREYAAAMRSDLVPYRDFEFEYPPVAAALFLLPTVASDDEAAYFWTFAALMALAGGIAVLVTASSLARLGRSRVTRRRVLALLAISPVAFGGVLLTRFDLVPAALVAVATLLLLSARPRLAGVALGVGAAVKWYPLALLPLFAVWASKRYGRRTSAFACALALGVVAIAYAPFLVLAPDDVASSVWRQLSRPLQIESLGAGALVVLHHLAGLDMHVESAYGSQNIVGGTAGLVAVALSALGVAALASLWFAFARGQFDQDMLVRFAAAALVAVVAFGKVLSPQFLIWLLFPLALVAGRRGASAGACFAVAAVATAVWFPWRYFDLPRDLDPFVAGLVVLRGLALVAALAILAWPRSRVTALPWSPRLRAGAGGSPSGARRPEP